MLRLFVANKEKQKRQLACLMAYGKEMPETPRGPKVLHKARREPVLNEDDPFEYSKIPFL